jgi:DNA polymerase III epsilon subunit-like protein
MEAHKDSGIHGRKLSTKAHPTSQPTTTNVARPCMTGSAISTSSSGTQLPCSSATPRYYETNVGAASSAASSQPLESKGSHIKAVRHAKDVPTLMTSPSRSIVCGYKPCPRTFATAAALQQHLESGIHGKIASPRQPRALQSANIQLDNRRLACPCSGCICEFDFESALRWHIVSGYHVFATMTNASTERELASCLTELLQAQYDFIQPASFMATAPIPTDIPYPSIENRWTTLLSSQFDSTLSGLKARIHPEPGVLCSVYYAKKNQLATPGPCKSITKRPAVALDCEMVGIKGNKSALARLSVIDYLTGETLVDQLVQPEVPIVEYRSKVTGITRKLMDAAVANNRALKGTAAARAELWKYIDSSTIIVGHALHHDLKALKVKHKKIVDPQILLAEIMGPEGFWTGLKKICKELLWQDIQTGAHDSLEDAFAAREVVLWSMTHEHQFLEWAEKRQREHAASNARKQQRKPGKRQHKKASQPSQTGNNEPSVWDYDSDDLYEIMTEEEFKEMCGIPQWYDGNLLD